MSLYSDLVSQKNQIEQKLAILVHSPEDVFNFGTIAMFASQGNSTHWHYRKTGEEEWQDIAVPSDSRPLSEWVLHAHEAGIGYFEVYILVPGAPIYASA